MSVQEVFTAGQLKEFNGAGDFFRILESADPVSVTFYLSGKEVARAESVKAGYSERFLTGGFDRVAIKSATAQTVAFVVRLGGEVWYDVPPVGNVVVTNAPALNGPFTQGTVALSSAGAPVNIVLAKPGRRRLIIKNAGSQQLFLTFDASVPSSSSYPLEPGAILDLEGYLPTERVRGVFLSSTGQVYWVEA